MKNKLFIIMIAGVLLASCGKHNENSIQYKCEDISFNVIFDKEKAKVIIGDEQIDLNIAISASGARYTGEYNKSEVELWTKGENAFFKLKGKDYKNCKVKK